MTISMISKKSFYKLEYARNLMIYNTSNFTRLNFLLLLKSQTNFSIIQASCCINLSNTLYRSLIYPRINLYMI